MAAMQTARNRAKAVLAPSFVPAWSGAPFSCGRPQINGTHVGRLRGGGSVPWRIAAC